MSLRLQKRKNKNKTVMHNYTKEDLKKLGMKSPVVDGYQDLLDINKLIKRVSKEKLSELAQKQVNANYGVQDNKTIREIMIETKKLAIDFNQLSAVVREHFKNDEFAYHQFLEENKENKYALAELTGKLTKSPNYQRHIENMKNAEKQKEEELLKQQQPLVNAIKEALKNDASNATKTQGN